MLVIGVHFRNREHTDLHTETPVGTYLRPMHDAGKTPDVHCCWPVFFIQVSKYFGINKIKNYNNRVNDLK